MVTPVRRCSCPTSVRGDCRRVRSPSRRILSDSGDRPTRCCWSSRSWSSLVSASAVDDPGEFQRSFVRWLSNLPGLLDFFWSVAYDFVQIWVLVVALSGGRSSPLGAAPRLGRQHRGHHRRGAPRRLARRRRGAGAHRQHRRCRRTVRISLPRARGRRRLRSRSRVRTSSGRCAGSAGSWSSRHRSRGSSSARRNPVRRCVRSPSGGPPARSSTCCSGPRAG